MFTEMFLRVLRLLETSASAFVDSHPPRCCLHALLTDCRLDGEGEGVEKRSSRDLAFFQMYRLCDRDRNGHFTHSELSCLNQMLHMILLGVRS